MLRLALVLALLATPALAQNATSFARHDKLALRAATPNRVAVPRFDLFELKLDVSATYDNPFDPDDVTVEAVFTSPTGKTFRVPGFLDQAYSRRLENGTETLTPAGEPVWKVRFAPDAVGRWRYQVSVKDRSGTATLPGAAFTATASASPGYVQRSRNNPAVFAFSNEKPLFLVGENMGWGGKRGSYDYDDWLPALGKAGGNWARVWMSSWNCALEWSEKPQGDWRSGTYHGVGVYALDNAWKLDAILDTAAKNGVYVMACLGTYGEFREGGFFNEGQWKVNPYNVANGGPCAKPDDFWTNPTARKLYQRRLRYIMARYGWRTGIQSFEFWNEADAPVSWIGEMARFLKGTGEFAGRAADPYGHLLTTTYGNEAIWKLPEIDFSQTHSYGTGEIVDHAPVVHGDAAAHAQYGKPHLMGEFGIDWRAGDEKYDPEGRGLNLHNGLWSAAMSGDAGGAMLWWWDGYVHPKNLYGAFTPLRHFADKVNWTSGAWKPLQADAPVQTSGPKTWTDLVIPATRGWGKAPQTDFEVTPTGLESGELAQHLFSPGKADLRTTPTFHVRFERPGQFIIHVNDVSVSAKVRVSMDGKVAREFLLSASPPADPNVKPEYETTTLSKEWNVYQAVFNKDYAVDVPAGEHVITLDNVEGDWLSLGSIRLTSYRSSRNPDVHLYGLIQNRTAILWLQNGASNWKNVADKKEIPVLTNLETTLHGVPPGRYTVEWWDTWKGTILRRETAQSAGGTLKLRVPELTTDVAARIEPDLAERR